MFLADYQLQNVYISSDMNPDWFVISSQPEIPSRLRETSVLVITNSRETS